MEKNSRNIYTVITTSLLAIAGLVLVIMSFCKPFYSEYGYSTVALTFFAVVFSIFFSVLFCVVPKKWMVWAGFALFFGIFFVIFREPVIGGAGIAVNEVINETSGYFDSYMWFIDIPKYYLREADGAMAVYAFILLLSVIYTFCISTPKLMFVPFALSLLLFVYPLVLEKNSGGFWVLFGIVYLMVLLVTAMSAVRKRTSEKSVMMLKQSMIIFGLIVCVFGGIALGINPEKRFERAPYFERVYTSGKDLYDRYTRGELAVNKVEDFFIALNPFKKDEPSVPGEEPDSAPAVNPSASGNVSTIGAGELGQVDKLVFSGAEALEVLMPEVDGKVYVKGFIGADYTGTRWIPPRITEIGYGDKFYAQTMLFDLYEIAGNSVPDGIYSTTMRIRNKTGTSKYKFVPIYPASSSFKEDAYLGEADFNDFGDDVPLEFIIFDEKVLTNIEYPYVSLKNDPKFADFERNEMIYRQYVYENYLDVNTPIADDLYIQWGQKNTETAADRYEVACAIRNFLTSCRYTTSPGKLPEGEDFVEYFLYDTKEGYCTYFATAAVMMLRSAGIPARYVEGYSFTVGGSSPYQDESAAYIDIGPDGRTVTMRQCRLKSVPDRSAHAWVEYYVDGAGWVDFEVTPGNYSTVQEPVTKPQQTTAPRPTQENHTTSPSDKPTTGQAVTTPGGNGGGFRFRIKLSKTAERVLVCIAVLAFISAVLAVIAKMRVKKFENLYDRIYNMGDDEPCGWCVIRMYKDYIRLLGAFGYARKSYETETDFAKRVAKDCRFVAESEALKMVSDYEKTVFDRGDITSDLRVECWHTYMAVRMRMYGSVGVIKKIILKYILCL